MADIRRKIDLLNYQKKYAQVIPVAASGADYATITDALNSVSDAATGKRYCILVYPGTYSEAITMKNYVDVVGVDRYSCIITQADATVVNLRDYSTLANITIKVTAPSTARTIVRDNAASHTEIYVRDVDVIFTGDYQSTGIYYSGTGAHTYTDCRIERCTIVGTSSSYGVGIQFGNAALTITRSGIFRCDIRSVRTGIYAITQSSLPIKNCYVEAGTNCLSIINSTDSSTNTINSYHNVYVTGNVQISSSAATRTSIVNSYHDVIVLVSKSAAGGTETFNSYSSTVGGILQNNLDGTAGFATTAGDTYLKGKLEVDGFTYLDGQVGISGDLRVDGKTLYVDSTNNRVQIGEPSVVTNMLAVSGDGLFEIGDIGSSTTDFSRGLALKNPTIATASQTVQNSPAFVLDGRAWTGSADKQYQWALLTVPSTASSVLPIYYKVGTAAWSYGWSFRSDGLLLTNVGSIAETVTERLRFGNGNNATGGADQYTPSIYWQSQGWKTEATAATQYVSLGHCNAPEQGYVSPKGVHKWFYGINTTTPAEANELFRFTWGTDAGFTGAIFNEGSLNDYTFRVEGASLENLLRVNASGDNVGIGVVPASSNRLEVSGKIGISGDVNVNGFMGFGKVSSCPTGGDNTSGIFASGDGSATELYAYDAAGIFTKISPHDEEGEWEFYSGNRKTGKVKRIKMEKLVNAVEKLTGEKFLFYT